MRLERIDKIEELLRMAAVQTAENSKQIAQTGRQLQQMAREHDREMKELRTLFKRVIRKITV